MFAFSYKRIQRTRGFTLVELMVALTIFSIVMLISTGTLLIMIDINARAQALYSSSTNLSFALDSMTREIRTGGHYNCGTFTGTLPTPRSTPSGWEQDNQDCINGSSGIGFIRGRDNFQIFYRQNGNTIEQYINNPSGTSGETGGWIPIISDDVVIDEFLVTVVGSERWEENYASGNGDTEQAYADILIKGRISNGLNTDTGFNIQTRIVQRLLDL